MWIGDFTIVGDTREHVVIALYEWMNERMKEGNVLFNDALNTFYFTVLWRQTYGKRPLR